jgi:hypothetical protein
MILSLKISDKSDSFKNSFSFGQLSNGETSAVFA